MYMYVYFHIYTLVSASSRLPFFSFDSMVHRWDSVFLHPLHLQGGMQVLKWWMRWSHYSALYEIPATAYAQHCFESSFLNWIPGYTDGPFCNKTDVRRVVILWASAQTHQHSHSVTIVVECRFFEDHPWSAL